MQGHQANKLHEQTKLDQNIHVGRKALPAMLLHPLWA